MLNLGGLNNLNFVPKAAAKPSTSDKSEASAKPSQGSGFAEVLGQKAGRAPGLKSEKNTRVNPSPDRDPAADDAAEESTDTSTNTYDAGFSAPSLNSGFMRAPLGERVLPNTNPLGRTAASAMTAADDEGVDSLTRRAVWTDFLRKMKDDLGVSPEDMLEAFQSLSDEDLAQPPQASVDKIVMALGLNDQQAQLARQYLQNLVEKTRSPSLGQELNVSEKQIALTAMSERDLQRKAVQSSLDRMNASFFMQGAFKPSPAKAGDTLMSPTEPSAPIVSADAPVSLSEADDVAPLDGEASFMKATLGELNAPNVKPQSAPIRNERPALAAKDQRAINELTAQMQPTTRDATPDVTALVQKFMQGQAPATRASAAPVAEMPLATSAKANVLNAPTPAAANPAGALNALLSGFTDGEDATGDGDTNGDEALDASTLGAQFALGDKAARGANALGSDFKTQLAAQGQPAQPVAVPELVQQAQVMARDGGGEMKVTMTPEGLGEVAMKVSVKDGKVHVQMVTESDEAKKLIERQIGELKSSLSTHHLHVGDIKIDTATNLGQQLEQQYQDAQRQSTQAQWEQFRQDNQGWRRSFFDTPSQRAYKGQADATRDVSAPSVNASARGQGSRRLDLVA